MKPRKRREKTRIQRRKDNRKGEQEEGRRQEKWENLREERERECKEKGKRTEEENGIEERKGYYKGDGSDCGQMNAYKRIENVRGNKRNETRK